MQVNGGFEKCQRCGSKSSGTAVYQCKSCRKFFCQSCKLNSEQCPNCGEDHYGLFSSNWQKLGEIL
ncbi:MAG: hypothetical protein D6814_17470 [Calditrichaeota bacterium]|nr:MAG: hypothetical protein D6814_17470 [Calditrichota bacterium]